MISLRRKNQNLLGIIACFILFNFELGFALSSAVLDTTKIAKMQSNKEKRPQVSFSHVHLYVDHLEELEVYKDLENRLSQFAKECKAPIGEKLEEQRQLWKTIQPDSFSGKDPSEYVPQNRDLVQQLLAGFGFRITGCRYPSDLGGGSNCNTRSVLVTSKDPSGVQFLLTAKDPIYQSDADIQKDPYNHFDVGK